jgi:hypothetical protein
MPERVAAAFFDYDSTYCLFSAVGHDEEVIPSGFAGGRPYWLRSDIETDLDPRRFAGRPHADGVYTAVQWSAMDKEVRQLPGRPKGLFDVDRNVLLYAAREYMRANLFAEILNARNVYKLEEILSQLEARDALLAEHLRAAPLGYLRDFADGARVPLYEVYNDEKPGPCIRTRNAKTLYQIKVLAAWRSFGGNLAMSCNESGAARGPLWRFFCAAAEPVLGPRMPKSSGFRDIVESTKGWPGLID